MGKARDNHRKNVKEEYKRKRTFEDLERVITVFHQEQVEKYGEVFLRACINIYSLLLIKYALLYSKGFCQHIDSSRTAALVAKLILEIEDK